MNRRDWELLEKQLGDFSSSFDAPYKSGPSRAWLKIKNPKAPAATRGVGRNFLTNHLCVLPVAVHLLQPFQ
jgi:hypothetical protein